MDATFSTANGEARLWDDPRMSEDASCALRVLVTGANGLIGGAVCARLRRAGHEVLVAQRTSAGEANFWDVESGEVALLGEPPLDAVIHLAGAPIAPKRWTARRKSVLWQSRVDATAALCRFLLSSRARPGVFIHASAGGYYGSRETQAIDESAPRGDGFLAELAEAWEASTQPLASAGWRVVHARFGMVLSGRGGALRVMLPAFRLGLGGPLGSGRQGVSWISLNDAARAVEWMLTGEGRALSGAVNVVAARPVSQRHFATALGKALHRPAIVPAPAWAVRLALGELGDELLLSGQFVVPSRLVAAGFAFEQDTLDSALIAAVSGAM